jgi:FlaA1/EpsC-like NDP-sugar epimerase
LILQAAAVGSGGEIFVLDMGEPVNITYLAEQMIRLSGREPGVDIKIVYTGLRPGEKLNEELFLDAERLTPTPHHKIQLAQHVEVDPRVLADLLGALARAVEIFDEVEIERLLREAVPQLGVIQPGSADAANVIAFNRGAAPL